MRILVWKKCFLGDRRLLFVFPLQRSKGFGNSPFLSHEFGDDFFWLVNKVANVLHVFLIILASTLQFPNPLAEIYLCWPSSSFEISLQLYRNTDFLAWKFTPPNPWKLTCPLKRCHFQRKVVLRPWFFGGHACFRGSFPLVQPGSTLAGSPNPGKMDWL